MTAGRVVALHRHPARHEADPQPAEQVTATELGIEGDVHHGRRGGKRQVLLVHAGNLQALGLEPGDLREQITVDLPWLMEAEAGRRIRVGDAVVEITGVCEPCTHIGEHLGVDDTEAFRRTLVGRRGMLGRIVAGGSIRVGDPVGDLG